MSPTPYSKDEVCAPQGAMAWVCAPPGALARAMWGVRFGKERRFPNWHLTVRESPLLPKPNPSHGLGQSPWRGTHLILRLRHRGPPFRLNASRRQDQGQKCSIPMPYYWPSLHDQVIMSKAKWSLNKVCMFQRFRVWWGCSCTCHMESVRPHTVTCWTQTCGSRFTMCLLAMPARCWDWVWTVRCPSGERVTCSHIYTQFMLFSFKVGLH